MRLRTAILAILILFFTTVSRSQLQPFVCDASFYLALNNAGFAPTNFYSVELDSTFQFSQFGTIQEGMNSIGYNRRDNFIYGLDQQTPTIYRIDRNANFIDLGLPTTQITRRHVAGDCDSSGNYVLASLGQPQIVVVDVSTNPAQTISVATYNYANNGGSDAEFADIAFHPHTNICYGFDANRSKMATIDPATGTVTTIPNAPIFNGGLGALFFDVLGNLFGYTGDRLYQVNIQTGEVQLIANGPGSDGRDGCSCPYSVDLSKSFDRVAACEGDTVAVQIDIYNATGRPLNGVTLSDTLASRFRLISPPAFLFGGTFSNNAQLFKIENMQLPTGGSTINLTLEVLNQPDTIRAIYNQAVLSNLSLPLPDRVYSDDTTTLARRDPTQLLINHLPEITPLQECSFFSLNVHTTDTPYQVLWSDGSIQEGRSFLNSGNYGISVTSSVGCFLRDSVDVVSTGTEDCNNGLDDDCDGFIDCYDTDCNCSGFIGNDVDCSLDPADLQSNFTSRIAWQSTVNQASIDASPMVANLNPQQDSLPEIVVTVSNTAISSTFQDRLLIFRGDGSNANAPAELMITNGYDGYPAVNPAIADIDRNGIPELAMISSDRLIRIYTDYDPNANPPMREWVVSSDLVDFENQKPYFADFDSDGIPEIYVGNDIFVFDLSNPLNPSLSLALSGTLARATMHWSGSSQPNCSPVAVDILKNSDCGGDPDCSGAELIAGSVIYSIDLDPNDGDGLEIKVQRDLNQMVPSSNWLDGYTATADMNLDGTLDVIVSSGRDNQVGVYVWNKDGLIHFFAHPVNNSNSGGLPAIANVFDETTQGYTQDLPEIVICCANRLNCYNLNAANANAAAPYWWSLPTTDASGATGATVFDFNGDTINEIVYRDQDNLRIMYGGPAPFPPGVDANRNWSILPSGSGTFDEYPVVADLDNDAQAEIAYTTYTFSGSNGADYRGRLRVLEADLGSGSPWMAARSIWNQFNYHVVNVNDDASIPAQAQAQQVEATVPGSGYRPMNQFLAQISPLDNRLEPYIPLPDLVGSLISYSCEADSLQVNYEICNQGDQTAQNGIPSSFYLGDPTASSAALIQTELSRAELPSGRCVVDSFAIVDPGQPIDLWLVVNDSGNQQRPFLIDSMPFTPFLECDYFNNIDSLTNLSCNLPPEANSDRVSACYRDSVIIHVLENDTDRNINQILDTLSLSIVNQAIIGNVAIELNGPLTYRHLQTGTSGVDSFSYQICDNYSPAACDTAWVYVDVSAEILVLGQVEHISCFGLNDGSISTTVNGGTAPFAFNWDDGFSTSLRDSLNLGIYSVLVNDSNGCRAQDSFLITQPDSLQLQLINRQVNCFDSADGRLEAIVSGGIEPYLFNWSNGGSTNAIVDLATGQYSIEISDSNQCIVRDTGSIRSPDSISAIVTARHLACADDSNGSITINVTGGTEPYNFAWSTGNQSDSIANLTTGYYAVSIADSLNCPLLIDSILIGAASPMEVLFDVLNLLCRNDQSGSISTQISGGTQPYQLNWSNSDTSGSINNLSAGLYHLTVVDSNGCEQIFPDIEVTEPLRFRVQGDVDNISCFGFTDGSIDVNVLGGTPAYNFNWSNGSSDRNISDLSPGFYTLFASDSNGCADSAQFVVLQPPPDSFLVLADSLSCFNLIPPDGSIEITPLSQDNAPYTYSLNGQAAQNSNVFNSLQAGDYDIEIVNTNGCVSEINATVFEPEVLSAVVIPDSVAINMGEQIQLNVIADSTRELTYFWQPIRGLSCYDCPNPVASPYIRTQYTVTVYDISGGTDRCRTEAEALVAVRLLNDLFAPNVFTPNGDGINDEFTIYGEGISKLDFKIFNRIGEKVFDSFDKRGAWNGMYRGKLVNPGAYAYYATVTFFNGEIVPLKGTVTVVY